MTARGKKKTPIADNMDEGGPIPRQPWSIPVVSLARRAKQWSRLTQTQREWIYAQHANGKDEHSIVLEFFREFGTRISRPVVHVVVREEALPEFTPCQPYRCSGCRKKVISKPCIICTAQSIYEATA